MKKKVIAGLATAITLANVALPAYAASAQEMTGSSNKDVPFSITIEDETPTTPGDGSGGDGSGDGGTGDGGSEETPIESDYIITIPSGIDATPKLVDGEINQELAQFDVTAKNVNLPENEAVQVDVQATEPYQVDGKNHLISTDGDDISYSFNRDEATEYGFAEGFNEGDVNAEWTVAQFRTEGHELFTNAAPVSITTDDMAITPGTYSSMLQFNVGVVDTTLENGSGDGGTGGTDGSTGGTDGSTGGTDGPVGGDTGAETPTQPAEPETPVETSVPVTDAKFFTTIDTSPTTVDIIGYDVVNGPKELNIPSEIDGKTVTGLNTAQLSNKEITYLEIPGTIKVIDKAEFRRMENLEKLVLNEGLETIEAEAFWSSTRNLKEIIIPDSVTTVKGKAFTQSSTLTTPSKLERIVIGENAEFVPDSYGNTAYFGTTIGMFDQLKVIEFRSKTMGEAQFNAIMDTIPTELWRRTYPVKFMQGSVLEQYFNDMGLYNYYDLIDAEKPSISDEQIASYKAQSLVSTNFAKDGLVEIGEDVLNEHVPALGYFEKSYSYGNYFDGYGRIKKGSVFNVHASIRETSSSTISTPHFDVEPGQQYYIDLGETPTKAFDIIGTNGVHSNWIYKGLHHVGLEQLTHRQFIYTVPTGVKKVTISMSESKFKDYGMDIMSDVHIVRIK